jgi:hypothetical protein
MNYAALFGLAYLGYMLFGIGYALALVQASNNYFNKHDRTSPFVFLGMAATWPWPAIEIAMDNRRKKLAQLRESK